MSNTLCNLRVCDDCRKYNDIPVVREYYTDNGQRRTCINHLFCWTEARNLTSHRSIVNERSVSVQYADMKLLSLLAKEDNENNMGDDTGCGATVEGQADHTVLPVVLDSQEPEREVETEDAVGETYRG